MSASPWSRSGSRRHGRFSVQGGIHHPMSVPGAGIDAHLRVSDLAVQAAKNEIARERQPAPAPVRSAPTRASARKSRPGTWERPINRAQREPAAVETADLEGQRSKQSQRKGGATAAPRNAPSAAANAATDDATGVNRATPATRSPPAGASMRLSASALMPASASGCAKPAKSCGRPAWETGSSSHGFVTSPAQTRRQQATQETEGASPARAQQYRHLPARKPQAGIVAPRQDTGPQEPRPCYPKNMLRTISGCGRRGTTDGSATVSCYNAPIGICALRPGSIVVADSQNDRLRWLRRQPGSDDPGEWISTSIGGDSWHRPQGVCSAEGGRAALVCDTGHHRVRIVQLPGDDAALSGDAAAAEALVATLAGSGVRGHIDGSAESAAFNGPAGVCFASDGSVIVADSGNCCIRRITRRRDGGGGLLVSTIAGPGTRGHVAPVGTAGHCDGAGFEALFSSPVGITPCAGGRLLVADRKNHALRLLVPPAAVDHGGFGNGWSVQTVAGHECTAGLVDGACISARLSGPCAAVELADGSALVVDSANHALRRLDVHVARGDATVAQAAAAKRPGEARRWLRSYKATHGTWASVSTITLPCAAKPPGAAEGAEAFANYEPPVYLPRGIAVLEDHTDCSPKEVVVAIADSGNQRVRVVTLGGDSLCLADDERNLMASAHTERAAAALLLNGGAGASAGPRPLPPQGSFFAAAPRPPSFAINEHTDDTTRRLLEESSAAAAQRLASAAVCSPARVARRTAVPLQQDGSGESLERENRRLRSLLNIAADKIEVLVSHIEARGIALPSNGV